MQNIQDRVAKVSYHLMPGTTTTFCQVDMVNGYTIWGMSACVDPTKYNQALGEKYSFEDALNKAWPLEGYLLAERLFWERAVPVATNPPEKPVKARKTAPFGLKKDGTPKKRPGRPAK